MSEFDSKYGSKKGAAPGTLIFVGEQKMDKPQIEVINYDSDHYEERQLENIEEVFAHLTPDNKHWINVNGLHEASLIEKIGEELQLDPLLLEDILHTTQRPKCEIYGKHAYIVLRMIYYNEKEDVTISEQFSLLLADNYIFTFQEVHGDVLNSVRERLKRANGKIRTRASGYLAYALLDTIVDHYAYSIEKFGDKIDELDREVLVNPEQEVLEQIISFKREINYLRKSIRPVRELIIQFDKSHFVEKKTEIYLKDLLDHVTHAAESIETYRELLSDQLNIYHTGVSNKLNEIIRLLTIYSVIFIPLTFLAGIYGMNFKHFPELDYPYAYPIFWGVLITISLSMVFYFRRKKWI